MEKIRDAAIFLDQMSLMHSQRLKDLSHELNELGDEQKFLESQMMVYKVKRHKAKVALSEQSAEFDALF